MKLHANAALAPDMRRRLVRDLANGMTMAEAARVYRVAVSTARRWRDRAKECEDNSLMDRSSRPHRLTRQIPDDVRETILRSRQEGLVMVEIAKQAGVSLATVSRVVKKNTRS